MMSLPEASDCKAALWPFVTVGKAVLNTAPVITILAGDVAAVMTPVTVFKFA